MTKSNFVLAYRAMLAEHYEWAKVARKLDMFMTSVEATVYDGANTWNHTGDMVTAAWQSIGGKGKPTKKALRALPA